MRHRLVERQLAKATRDGVVSVEAFADLVSAAYVHADAERARTDNSTRVMSEELMKLHREATADASARVRAIFDAVGEGIVMVATDGTVEALNRAAEVLFAIDSEDARGRPIAGFGLGDVGPYGSSTTTAIRKDGSTFPAELTSSEVLLDHRRVRVIILRDVSDRHEQQARIEEAMAKAEAASRAKSDFLATMSHEIRTPMNGVIGMVGLLLDTQLSATQLGYAATIRDSADALLVLINDILDFSKIEARTVELEKLDFALVPLVESVIELLAPRAHAKGIEVAACVAKDVPRYVRGDAGRLRQVLTNFVGNGIKFTDRGEVSLEVVVDVGPSGEKRVRFDVVDTGPGIADVDKARLFQEFVQVDSSSTRRHGGTGLGLAISKRIVDAMGGSVGIRDTDGGGSTFFAVVPFEDSGMSSDAPLDDRERRILVVDDNLTNRRIFERQLGNLGFRVESVESGDLGLAAVVKAAFGDDPFHLAIVDHQMPGMNGEIFARTLKGIPPFASIPLVLASSGGAEALQGTDAESLFAAILTKPIRQSALRETVARSMGDEAVHAPTAPPPVKEPTIGKKLRVLVVDDNHVNTLVAAGYLERAGHRVDCAASGREAVDAITSFPYDVVLMDVHMPDMDGLAATSLVRSLPSKRAKTPIIALTASAMREDREACLAAGMDDFLPKPFERGALLAMVDRWGRAPAAEEAPAAPPTEELPVAGDAAFWKMVDELCEVGAHDVYESFAKEARRDATELREAIATGDKERLRKTAHRIKGASGTLALGVISSLASRVEATCKAGTEDPFPLATELVSHTDATAGFLGGAAFAAALERAKNKALLTGS